jgi:hypothetical protein
MSKRLSQRLAGRHPEHVSEWSNWDERRRRTLGGAIDQRTFQMLRGLEERKFSPTQA